jgi:hypothetical protein
MGDILGGAALQKDDFFDPKSAAIEQRREILSPSTKYKLVVTPFATSPGCWNYTQGLVYRRGDDQPIAEIRRNYSAFPSSWIEGHANGHDYLVAGEDYQGQTVIELDTGKRGDSLSEGADKGHGFCWAAHRYEPSAKMLVVHGCIWACPYEYRFYDFSEPMSGWPELETGKCMYGDRMEPTFEADGSIKCCQAELPEDDDDEADPKRAVRIAAFTRFRREGLKLVEVEEWISDAERGRRAEREESERKDVEWTRNFKNTDPLYLAHAELVKDPALSPDAYESVGRIYKGWSKDYTMVGERRWCRRILHEGQKTGKGYTVDLEWGVEAGPIKLVIYKDGKTLGNKWFEHSVSAMCEAFAYAKSLS